MTLLQPGWTEGVRQVNGLSLHVVEAGPADGPLLILLHGFPEFWWAWRNQMTPFAESGYHVVVPDQRGYNSSDAPQEISSYRLDKLVDDVIALADHYGAETFHLAGHDWGGIVAWGVAASHAHRLTRLIIMDAPHPDLWAKDALLHPTQAIRSTYVAFFQLPWLPETVLGALDFAALSTMMASTAKPATFKPADLERYVAAWRHEGSLTGMLNYYGALRERTKSDPPARIVCPTLVLWGEKDSLLEHHVALAALEQCDNGRLSII